MERTACQTACGEVSRKANGRPDLVAIVFLVAANLLPLAGVVWWGWDAFVLLILYWMETAIIGFWTVLRIVVVPSKIDVNGKPMDKTGLTGRMAFGLFILVHAGIFMTVHFIFLWALFSGGWSQRIHSVGTFVSDLVIGTDLWIPLAFLFLVRGGLAMAPVVRRRLGIVDSEQDARDAKDNPLTGLYLRIFVMQFTIIVGAWFAVLAGDGTGPLVLLVALKTAIDLFYERIGRHIGVGAEKAAD